MSYRDPLTRRRFLQSTLAASSAAALGSRATAAAASRAFSFVLLGDLHFDRSEHHDHEWLQREKPDDVRQVANYSRLTREITPSLFATVRRLIEERKGTDAPVAFVLQVGDLVEGLCGSERLATKQNREALEFVAGAKLGVPFLFTKGNHDVTGPGANEAFNQVFLPFLDAQVRRVGPASGGVKSARYTVEHVGAQFAFFDAYDRENLDWLEAIAAKRTARHLFVVIHPPVVPYGARATWHLYSGAKDRAKREKLLELLARQQSFVLGGHIHRFNTLVRAAGRGRFAQLAVSSIISTPDVKAKDALNGIADYNGDQIRVEPKHSPATEPERRAVYEAEREFVRAFEYADLPGYALVTVNGAGVESKIFAGIGREVWRTVRLDKLLMLPA